MPSLITGSAIGNVDTQETIFFEGSPTFYIQQYEATPLYNPDSDGYYWGMSGTSSYPAFELGCMTDVSFTEGITMNTIRCDAVGDRGVVQRRDYVEFSFTISTLLDLDVLRHLMNLSTPTIGSGKSKAGIGQINNNRYYMVYAPKVYDQDSGDYFMMHLHRAQFVDAATINMKGGDVWTITGLKLRAFADTTKPANQLFGTIVRSDLSAIP